MRRPLATALALVIASSLSAVPAAFAADAAPAARAPVTTQLPRSVKPSHYAIRITPHAETMDYDAHVDIGIDVLEATSSITLNQLDMSFSNAVLVQGKKKLAAKVAVDNEAQTATFAFDKPLKPGSYVLSTDYAGKIGTQANGIFALDYATPAGKKRALYTQFENSDFRRFAPSWDEPYYKATFDLTATVPAAQMAVSNMPVKARKELGNGLAEVTFGTSPKMSTYLLFFSVGEFERATTKTKDGVEIGVIAQTGKVDQAAYALEAGKVVLEEYNDYFGVPFPLPKLDNIAAPGRSQFFSAMENWGAIFTFEGSLLFDPAISTIGDKQRIFGTDAHEIAHQWFGDLVTMQWWDDLWLNEGFATWMAGRTTRKLHPEWDIDGVDPAMTSRSAMGQDAIATTHPVVQHVETVEQASQAFDGITYQKGAAVISMLEDYIGADAWREGVRSYIKKHAYSNTATDDLWAEMEQVAPGKQFATVAHEFTLQPGVPLIKASARCDDHKTVVELEQGEFTVDRPDKQPLRWHVPVAVQAVGGQPVKVLVDGNASIELPGCGAPVLVNAGQKGYFRTLYSPEQFQALSANFDQLAPVDQLGVMMDVGALSSAGLQPVADALDLTKGVSLDASPDVWSIVAGTLGGMVGVYGDDEKAAAPAKRYARSRLSPLLQKLGWENKPDDSAAIKQLRTRLIAQLSGLGDEKVLAEARRRFAASETDPSALPAELRRTVLGIVARNADAATWDKLHAMAQKETSSMIRDQYYQLLAAAKDKALAQKALDMALTGEPGATNSAAMIGMVSRENPDMAFDFALAHREQVDELVDSTSRSRYYPRLGAGSDDIKMVDKLKDYADKYIAPTSRRDTESAIAGIQTRIKLNAARRPQIDAWLKKNAK
ncbi:M1 family metallopeptidase [Pseudoxanthomonas sangjuensis]|uniref:M1 family metallopeptidase n=1 Tax=Pseudoxanthomonas sangjuensis TaxID=1503750 RepID=UPI001390BEC4|nr:M1 family metallopeptidase [Pseudoxanthomonas sangjuensis]KAF1713506.1 aminopeptidase [Pseudoxanthomonas sangjuensis]